ncbi:MAG TPA: hypothetical protein VGX70_05970, partial [Gemmataceae bacterium]|nr:hypothetical protein [Gemmataceae bacterium]
MIVVVVRATDPCEIGGRTGVGAKLDLSLARASAPDGAPTVANLTVLNTLAVIGPTGNAFLKKPLWELVSCSESAGGAANANDDSFLARSASALACS